MIQKVFSITFSALYLFFFLGITQLEAGGMDYELFQKFLNKFVKAEKKISGFTLNVVDYNAIHRSKGDPASLYRQTLKMFSKFTLSTIKTKEEKIAFWINAYNIAAIKMIVDHYPVESIRSRSISWMKNPWGKNILTVAGKEYSLSEIEHDILLKKLKEPRAHFAIVCASLSCPDLSQKVYRHQTTLKEQLQEGATRFLRDGKKGLKIDKQAGNSLVFPDIQV